MQKNKKSWIIFILVGIIFYLLFICLSNTNKDEIILNNTSESVNESEMIIHPLEQVTSYQHFFTINTLINDYYQSIMDEDYKAVYNKLDIRYINKYNLQESDLQKDLEYTGITYYSTSMYSKGINDIYYFFVDGHQEKYHEFLETVEPEDDIKFLVILDTENLIYTITPLEINEPLKLYADTYKMEQLEIEENNYNSFNFTNMSDEDLTKYYLNYYKNLLYLNTEKAYNMLSDTNKQLYSSLEYFTYDLQNLYDLINTRLFGYEVKGENGKRSYYSLNSKDVRITMIEKSIMNFTVTIDK